MCRSSLDLYGERVCRYVLASMRDTARMLTTASSVRSDRAGPTVPLILFLLPVGLLVVLLLIQTQRADGRLHVWVLDVGQGDAILVRTPRGHTALIDGGPGATPLLNEMGEHLPFWQRDLDLMVLTHPHQDHVMGLIEVLDRYDVDQVVQTEFTATGSLEDQWLHAVKSEGALIHYPMPSETISFEGEPEIEMRVLGPSRPQDPGSKHNDVINNASVVLRLSYGKHDILLAGDAQEAAEAEMSRLPEELASEVLKVGHHGSNTSSTPRFVERVRPQVAIISVGAENKYGHPSNETLQTLQEAGAAVYRTDLNGTIELIADKERMWVRSER